MTEHAEYIQQLERCLIRTYRKRLWAKFIKAIAQYELIQDGDAIAVAISGGKDSLVLAKLFQYLHKYGKKNFSVKYMAMDPGYLPNHRKQLEDICAKMDIPVKIFNSDVFEVAEELNAENPCYLCARMRRGFLYGVARDLGCNKLALGHHMDDVIETTMMNIMCSASFHTMLPKLHAQNFPGMELIRPLYLIDEKDISAFMVANGLSSLDCACSISANKQDGSKRAEIKNLIAKLEPDFDNLRKSIFKSTENVEMAQILGWRDKEKRKHSFMDYYERSKE
ncbi:MAG: hypothetical protein GXZ11_03005 [Tissierellia bacterium]|nr:hypothetical protein [Tissierellia bacterium]